MSPHPKAALGLDDNEVRLTTTRQWYEGPPVTVGDLTRDQKLVWLYCSACHHEVEVDPASLKLPPSTPVPAVRLHVKCSKCGGREIESKPQLHPTPSATIMKRATKR